MLNLERSFGPIEIAGRRVTSAMPYHRVVRAAYSYEAVDGEELSFGEDELLCILDNKDETRDESWLLARPLQTRGDATLCGMVPANYLEPVLIVALGDFDV